MTEQTRMEGWIKRLRDLQHKDGDTENQHAQADDVLCEVLESLGCKHLVEEWKRVPRWYA